MKMLRYIKRMAANVFQATCIGLLAVSGICMGIGAKDFVGLAYAGAMLFVAGVWLGWVVGGNSWFDDD
jgi:hypothetical protein